VILVDTSVWIDHFRGELQGLVDILDRGDVVIHPFVIGELACGSLSNREETLALLQQLRSITVAEHDEVMSFIVRRRLYGRGIGYVDVHLLASVALDEARLWTKDRRLRELAGSLGLATTHDRTR
jgi:predicted nucleic acid-binding protein